MADQINSEHMHFVTVGATQVLVENLWERIAAAGGFRISHIVHPVMEPRSWERGSAPDNVHFFSDGGTANMPDPDRELLSSLEHEGVPTIHNMILSDRIVSRLAYADALAYSTFLSRRLMSLYGSLRPTAVIGAFDALHGSLAFAVARRMNLPWFALNFSVIPPGYACFCDRMSPAARVNFSGQPIHDMSSVAEASLESFERRKIQAPAYIAPSPRSVAGNLVKLPHRIAALFRTVHRSRRRQFLKFVEDSGGHDVGAALRHIRRTAEARSALTMVRTVSEPPGTPYVFFGLQLQPESSIDVWAPFFSNQMAVVELLARSIPPTHKLMVKIHKSDTANYSRAQLDRMLSFPGVELVTPFADARRFIENSDLVFSIQGTIGLEGALLGKPVIVFGESPVTLFPSASPVGKITDLPMLVRRKLCERPPARKQIVDAYREYLMPFAPAGHNDWAMRPDDREIDGYAALFSALVRHLQMRAPEPAAAASSR